jgi:hypothetical protein
MTGAPPPPHAAKNMTAKRSTAQKLKFAATLTCLPVGFISFVPFTMEAQSGSRRQICEFNLSLQTAPWWQWFCRH